ncbi:hypothetical protein QNN00_07330 [Bacillus velezensis]|nr:hypothetical protein [Bacillus velezensis]
MEPDIFITVKNGIIQARLNSRSFPDIQLHTHYQPRCQLPGAVTRKIICRQNIRNGAG